MTPKRHGSSSTRGDHPGFQVAVHANGQRSGDLALDAYSFLDGEVTRVRHRVEHSYLPALPGQLERMSSLGFVNGVESR